MAEPATADLVRRAQGGDRAALEHLFARYYDRVRRIVGIRMGARVRTWTDSVDIMTRTLLKAAEKLPGFEPRDDASLLQWLVAIAEGMVRDAVDERNAASRSPDRETPATPALPDGGATPPSRLASDENALLVDAAIEALPAADRDLLLRHYFLGRSWAGIAVDLGDHPASVRRRAHVARARLAIELQRRRTWPGPSGSAAAAGSADS